MRSSIAFTLAGMLLLAGCSQNTAPTPGGNSTSTSTEAAAPGGKVIDLPPQLLTLKAGASAIDAGVVLPNVHGNGFAGKAPDLGVHERGMPLPHYGARDDTALKGHADYWVLKSER